MTLEMVKSWLIHTAIAAAMNGAAVLVGLDPIVGPAFYLGHEVVQHQLNGTDGLIGWIDRLGDVGGPLLATIAMMALLG